MFNQRFYSGQHVSYDRGSIPEKKLLNKSSLRLNNKTWPITQRNNQSTLSEHIKLNCSLETKGKVCPL